MKKGSRDRKRIPPESSLARYDWSKSKRGRYVARSPRETHAVVIAPEIWPYFGSADAVNEGLRTLVEVAKVASKVRAGAGGQKSKGRSAA